MLPIDSFRGWALAGGSSSLLAGLLRGYSPSNHARRKAGIVAYAPSRATALAISAPAPNAKMTASPVAPQ
jgi:hypothetical protein